jgi:glutamate racemase
MTELGIGVFDSGVGGLTVASAIQKALPGEKIYYFGDTAHLPYGDRTEGQIIGYVFDIIEFLKKQGIKALVMACNTSSALVLPRLNGQVKVPTLGVIEFASRAALQASRSERIGVVANPLTVRSLAYPTGIKNISLNGTRIYQSPCPRWVPLVESGKTAGEEVERVVREDLEPLMEAGVDTLILGCTHYPYLAPVIRKIMGDGVALVDPAQSVALRLKEILEQAGTLSGGASPAAHRFFVSGNPDEFREKGSFFFGSEISRVEKVTL